MDGCGVLVLDQAYWSMAGKRSCPIGEWCACVEPTSCWQNIGQMRGRFEGYSYVAPGRKLR